MISAIIPAYNEGKTLKNVLEAIKQVKDITEIIVVDDGSSDSTSEIAKSTPGVKVISHKTNLGKTKAVLLGVRAAKNDIIALFDADLINLSSKHIEEFVRTYKEGYEMVLMDKGAQPWAFRTLLKSIPAETGTRILHRKYFELIAFKETDSFQLEVRINDYFLNNNLSIAVTPAEEVYDPRKFTKYPFLKGLYLDVKGGLSILASDGVMSIPKNLRMFRRIAKMYKETSSLQNAKRPTPS